MSATEEGIEGIALADMERRVANMVRYGKVHEINRTTKRVRIKSGELITDWIPWSAGRANGKKRRWDPPTVGEQVIMLAPTGDLRQAVVMPGVYQSAHDAPSTSADKDHTTYADGTVIEYDHGSHTATISIGSTSIVANQSSITLSAGGSTLVLNAAGITLNGATINLN